jgi:ribosomal protein S18 acetylase RimI-like enzyme
MIRMVTREDISSLIKLCALHAEYEQCEYISEGKEIALSSALFSSSPQLYCYVVEIDGEIIGYLSYMRQYSTWDAAEYLYMDCLFLKTEFRGNGYGEQLIQELKNEGKKQGISLIQWQTPDFNSRAIKFYKRIGAFSKAKERFFLSID